MKQNARIRRIMKYTTIFLVSAFFLTAMFMLAGKGETLFSTSPTTNSDTRDFGTGYREISYPTPNIDPEQTNDVGLRYDRCRRKYQHEEKLFHYTFG